MHIKNCLRKDASHTSDGLSALEATIALFSTALLLTATMRVLVGAWIGCDAVTAKLETDSAWLQVERVMETDLDGARSATTANGGLDVTLPNNTQYRYLVNANQELIRVEQNGGTAVIATGVISFRATSNSGLVHVLVVFENGVSKELTAAPLGEFER